MNLLEEMVLVLVAMLSSGAWQKCREVMIKDCLWGEDENEMEKLISRGARLELDGRRKQLMPFLS